VNRVLPSPPPEPSTSVEPAGPRVTVPHHQRLRDRVCEVLDLDDDCTDDTIVLALLLRLHDLGAT